MVVFPQQLILMSWSNTAPQADIHVCQNLLPGCSRLSMASKFCYRMRPCRKLTQVGFLAPLQSVLRKIKDVPKQLVRLSDMPGGFKACDFQVLKESMSYLVALRDVLLKSFQV